MNASDIELLSDYLDGALTPAQAAALEERLKAEPSLRQELESLRATVALLGDLPELRAPRDFRLTRAMIQPMPARRLPIPLFSVLSAAAAFILIAAGAIGLLNLASQTETELNMVAAAPTSTVTSAATMTHVPMPEADAESLAESLTMNEAADVMLAPPEQPTNESALRSAETGPRRKAKQRCPHRFRHAQRQRSKQSCQQAR